MDIPANPWGLSPREAEAVAARVDTGTLKGAARKMGVSVFTVSDFLRIARRKIGKASPLQCYCVFYAWRYPYQEPENG